MEHQIISNWENDPEGRVRNLSLAPNAKNALFPLFEAISNSIHAIEERFGRDEITSGIIRVEICQSEDDGYCGFIIEDNGIGFNEDNVRSLRRMDSQRKSVIGGKGVGRLTWLKVADGARITSTYLNSSSLSHVQFDFSLADPIGGFSNDSTGRSEVGTRIEINPYRSEYATAIPKKLATIANRIIAHFISYFVNIGHPKIVVFDTENSIDLFEAFSESVARDKDYSFKIDGEAEDFVLHCFLVPKAISDDEKSTNALYLGANGRAVTRHELDSVIGMKAIDGKYAFLGYVESPFLDASANATRTSFSLEIEQQESVVNIAKEFVREFLAPEIAKIRARQAERVQDIRREHPRFLAITRDPEKFTQDLHLSKQSEEDIYLELSRETLRTYKRAKAGYKEAVSHKLPEINTRAAEWVQKLQNESMSSLAEYVLRRKLVLEAFEDSLKYRDIEKESSEYEKVVHGIICPLQSSTEELSYDDHNLWVIDDRLAFYTYFQSDRRMDKQAADPATGAVRPDITLFDLGLGFESADPNQPITVIEFKRPKRDDYTLEENPIVQVQNYVELLRDSRQAIKFDGSPLRLIGPDTPFMCQIVADITPSLLKIMKRFGPFHRKAGSNCFYKWDEDYKAFIEVSSFDEIIRSAKARNQAFFDRLGL